jgi:hypothetical protein
MKLDPNKYRLRSTFTGKLVLQIRDGAVPCAGPQIGETRFVENWRDAKITDLNILLKELWGE